MNLEQPSSTRWESWKKRRRCVSGESGKLAAQEPWTLCQGLVLACASCRRGRREAHPPRMDRTGYASAEPVTPRPL
jgi:hypothetical protein